METSTIGKTKIQTEEQIFYFHPILTTLAFILTLPFFFALVYFAYKSWGNKEFDTVLPNLIFFILLAYTFRKIPKAFIRLLLKKPAIRLTDSQLCECLYNRNIDWAEIRQSLSFDLRWWSFLSIETLPEATKSEQIKSPIKRLFMRLNQFVKRKRILKINLLLIEGKNVDILSSIKLHSQKNKNFHQQKIWQ